MVRPVTPEGPRFLPIRDERHEFADSINDQYWAHKGIAPPEPVEGESMADYRVRAVAGLYTSAENSTLANQQAVEKILRGNESLQNHVIERTAQSAHTGPLTEIPYTDNCGRQCSRFTGRKSDWMNQFKAPVMQSPVYINGVPQRLGVIF
jgi:hypothetical protein